MSNDEEKYVIVKWVIKVRKLGVSILLFSCLLFFYDKGDLYASEKLSRRGFD